jgi:uncharacterized protein YecT (DUF1311 family)
MGEHSLHLWLFRGDIEIPASWRFSDQEGNLPMMMRRAVLLALAVAIPTTLPVQAAQDLRRHPLEQVYDKCLGNETLNNTLVMGCAEEASAAAKKEITRLYAKLQAELPAEDGKSLEEAQRSWIRYRDLHCKLAGDHVGTPMYSVCPMDLNIARAKELAELAGE